MSAQSERACVRMSPKTCARGLFLTEGGISWKISKNEKYAGYKVRRGRERERENNTVNRSHYFCRQQSRTGSARTTLGPITLLVEATTFATQPINNAERAAHALRSEKYYPIARPSFGWLYNDTINPTTNLTQSPPLNLYHPTTYYLNFQIRLIKDHLI
jgi:hypothetical protein